ncbi:MAG: hypothetical protein U0989_06275 [Azonexus sp.]|nr:hypothetical protein [Azonexus sp.]MDZ4314357.1 hypothetical protein [Azonexus sp.]
MAPLVHGNDAAITLPFDGGTEIDEIATAQLAVDREVEHCQVSNLMRVL